VKHIPVLLEEVLNFFDYLNNEEKVIADFTVGGGGHSEAILNKFKKVKILAFDKDSFAIDFSKKRLSNFKDRITFYKRDFSEFDKVIDSKISGALVDLGISSFQLEDAERGFSFNSDAFLDMRMDKSKEVTAYDIVNKYEFLQLQKIFKEYGEIKMPNRVIKSIINYRKNKPIETCKELAEIISKNFKYRGKIHPATKFFQAIRIEVNQELNVLQDFLGKIIDYLGKNSRLLIISFHSLEDRIVKNFFKELNNVKILTKKPVVPSQKEIEENPRSRSAKLRVIEIL
jgi:16S rRNA (cytosine1402-N4)-methyltransferase